MKQILANASNELVKATVLYGSSSHVLPELQGEQGYHYLYYDKDLKELVPSKDLFGLFTSGLVVRLMSTDLATSADRPYVKPMEFYAESTEDGSYKTGLKIHFESPDAGDMGHQCRLEKFMCFETTTETPWED